MFPSPPPWASLLSSPFCLLPSWQSQEAPGFHQAQTQRGRSWEGPEALALPETTQGPLLIRDLVAPKGTMARGFGRINILWMRGEACLPCFHPHDLGPSTGRTWQHGRGFAQERSPGGCERIFSCRYSGYPYFVFFQLSRIYPGIDHLVQVQVFPSAQRTAH